MQLRQGYLLKVAKFRLQMDEGSALRVTVAESIQESMNPGVAPDASSSISASPPRSRK